MNFARIWTGFTRQPYRSNVEQRSGLKTSNYYDPLTIDARFRDVLPKLDTYDRHIGDGYPLCTSLPPHAFLRPGARFRLLGASPTPKGFSDPTEWDGDQTAPRLSLNGSTSALYRVLCADPADASLPSGAPSGGACTFPLEVALDAILPCDGKECAVDTMRVVQLTSSSNVTYHYEYVPLPCTALTFFRDPQYGRDKWRRYCLDPITPSAGATCCDSDSTGWQTATPTCEYLAERVTLATAAARCAARGKHLCAKNDNQGAGGCGYSESGRGGWSSTTCSVRVQVRSERSLAAPVAPLVPSCLRSPPAIPNPYSPPG